MISGSGSLLGFEVDVSFDRSDNKKNEKSTTAIEAKHLCVTCGV